MLNSVTFMKRKYMVKYGMKAFWSEQSIKLDCLVLADPPHFNWLYTRFLLKRVLADPPHLNWLYTRSLPKRRIWGNQTSPNPELTEAKFFWRLGWSWLGLGRWCFWIPMWGCPARIIKYLQLHLANCAYHTAFQSYLIFLCIYFCVCYLETSVRISIQKLYIYI